MRFKEAVSRRVTLSGKDAEGGFILTENDLNSSVSEQRTVTYLNLTGIAQFNVNDPIEEIYASSVAKCHVSRTSTHELR